ncbi:hypothetical protein D9758_017708 [Tetrapyrgos nigripes]|uniref:Uncharacterized protein n=1 Tax=Tetrapyrgos nigripes TaxID=182062 RepID=A0A8H5CA30_9AGAR|nr:hypothetical protein D9758_017708 [Tetrapyrgos nigripes]
MLQAQRPASLPLSNSDLATLKEWIFQIAIEWLIHGVNVTLALTVFCAILSQQKYPSRPQLVLLAVVVFMLIIATTYATLNVLFVLVQIPLNGYNVDNVAHVIQQVTDIDIALNMVERLNYVIGDGIVLWRAWILFPRDLVVKGVLLICFMGSLGGALADGGLVAVRFLHNPADPGKKRDTLVMALPLLITNMAATGLIAYKAWLHGRDIRKTLKDCGNQVSRAQKILMLLVESGMIYCGIWITYIIINFSTEASSTAFTIISSALPALAIGTLYPILIILIVALEKSREAIRSRNDMSLSQSIRFASVETAASQPDSQVERQTEVMSE